MKLFVDTSAFYALADEADRHHTAAKAFYESVVPDAQLVTTDYILVECWYLLGSRLGRGAALQFWGGLRSGIVELLKVDLSDLDRARRVLQDFPDQDFSLVDAASFAVLEREGLEQVFTFNPHFRIYRYGPRKQGFFQVLP